MIMYRKRFKNWKEAKEHLETFNASNAVERWAWGVEAHENMRERLLIPNSAPPPRQFSMRFESSKIKKALDGLGVKKQDGVIVTAAAYIGKVPRAIRKAGFKVAYSDVLEDWVELAKEGKTFSKKLQLRQAPKIKEAFHMDVLKPHINDTKVSAIVSFEPVQMRTMPERVISENLGSKNGLIILMKRGTAFEKAIEKIGGFIREMKEKYSLQVREVEVDKKQEIIAYQFKIPEMEKKKYLKDREVFEARERFGSIGKTAKELGISEDEAAKRTRRFGKFIHMEW
jgi:hypothetical protein